VTCPACNDTGRVRLSPGEGCACDGCDEAGRVYEAQRIALRLDAEVVRPARVEQVELFARSVRDARR
jgi:hypothetical protein